MSIESWLALGILAVAGVGAARLVLSRKWRHTAPERRVQYVPSGDASNEEAPHFSQHSQIQEQRIAKGGRGL
ncbi:hypothetical protein R1X32_08895 (plasmid) [Rhodococcus opacus]|uniref:hypothetical protein n=1 Tax=Rhodococcus opacus TaxID=37919 RepID=UPI0034D2337E